MTVVSEASVVPEWSGVGVAGDDLAPPSVSVPDELVRRLLALSRPDLLLEEGLDLSLWSILLATVREMIPGVGPCSQEEGLQHCASHQARFKHTHTRIPPSPTQHVTHTHLLMHRCPQRHHGLAVGLAQERHAVDVDELVVLEEAAVARGGPAVDHVLYEDPQVDRAVWSRTCLALHAHSYNNIEK